MATAIIIFNTITIDNDSFDSCVISWLPTDFLFLCEVTEAQTRVYNTMPMVHSLHTFLVSCQEGDGGKVEDILQSGEVGVNSSDEGEITGLQVAAANGHEDVVRVLLERGAKVDQENSSGWTAVHQASYHGHITVVKVADRRLVMTVLMVSVKVLLGAGCDVNKTNRYGASPLHMAAAGGQLEVSRLLLSSGGKVEAGQRSLPSSSPAMTAALHGQETVLRVLIENGAKLDKVSASIL